MDGGSPGLPLGVQVTGGVNLPRGSGRHPPAATPSGRASAPARSNLSSIPPPSFTPPSPPQQHLHQHRQGLLERRAFGHPRDRTPLIPCLEHRAVAGAPGNEGVDGERDLALARGAQAAGGLQIQRHGDAGGALYPGHLVEGSAAEERGGGRGGSAPRNAGPGEASRTAILRTPT